MDQKEFGVYALLIIGGVLCFFSFCSGVQSCSRRTDENRLECIKANKTPDECMRLFHN